MHRSIRTVSWILPCLVVMSAAADWKEWRGPSFDGIAQPQSWSADFLSRENAKLWEASVGIGYSAAAVEGDAVYIAGWKDGHDHLMRLSLSDGSVQWTHSYPMERYDRLHEGGPGGSPGIDDKHVYLMDRDGAIRAVDKNTGDLVWKREIAKDDKVAAPSFRFTGSPRFHNGMVIWEVGPIVALDPKTGKDIWKTKDYGAAHSTSTPFTHNGRELLACFPRTGLVVLDAKSGEEVAVFPWKTQRGIHAASPIVADDGKKIFISTGYNFGCAALNFDGSSLKVAWEGKQMCNHMASSVAMGGYIYGFNESRLTCLRMSDGETMWSQRGLGKGSLMAVGKDLLVLSDSGELITAPAKSSAFSPTARRQVLKASNNWIVPVFANGRVLCRSATGQLVCFDATPAS